MDFYLYVTNRQARIIPKRTLSIDQILELRAMIEEMVGKPKFRIVC